MNHYTYQLTHNDIQYIGVRSSECLPEDDTNYWGSSRHNPTDLREVGTKEILQTYPTREAAMRSEMLLHECLDIAANPQYWNRAKQTSTGFDMSGTTMSDETRAKVTGENHWAFGLTGENHYLTGTKRSEESKAKQSASISGELNQWYGHTGEAHPTFGTTYTKTPKQIAKTAGENHGMFNKHHSAESRAIMSKNSAMAGAEPWNHTCANIRSLATWSIALELWGYLVFRSDVEMSKRGFWADSARELGVNPTSTPWVNLYNRIRSGWNPNLDSDYLQWRHEYGTT